MREINIKKIIFQLQDSYSRVTMVIQSTSVTGCVIIMMTVATIAMNETVLTAPQGLPWHQQQVNWNSPLLFLHFISHMSVYLLDKCEIRSSQGQVWGIRRSSASPRPPCDGTPSASVWPSPRRTPGPLCPYPSDRTPPDATMKPVDAPSARTTPSDLHKKESDGRDPP